MHVCFVTRLTEHLGIQLLAAICKARGHGVSHVFDPGLPSAGILPDGRISELLSTDAATVRRILDLEPDAVGFNVEINTFSWTVGLAQRLKQARPGLPVLVGGVHATTVPDVVMGFLCFDFLCVGEGDDALPELLDAMQRGGDVHGIPNIWSRRDGEVLRNPVRPLRGDLDDLPFFDKSIHYDLVPEMSREYHTSASRGCVYSCSFCFYQPIQRVYGGRFRTQRGAESVCAEVEEATARWPTIRTVTFHDEVFTANRPWLRAFADLWPRRVGLPFSIITHPELVDREVAALLGRAGCVHCILGTQTVNERTRRDVLDRTECKEDIRAAIRALKDQGIWVIVDHILGIPGETARDQDDALLFYSECRPDVVKAFFLTCLPGTAINRHAIENGTWTEEQRRQAELGHMDSWLFKGVGDIREWRSYFQLFSLFSAMPPAAMAFAVRHGLHRAIGLLDFVFLPQLFLLPRIARSLLGGAEEQPRAFVNCMRGLARYALETRLDRRPLAASAVRRALRPSRAYRRWWSPGI